MRKALSVFSAFLVAIFAIVAVMAPTTVDAQETGTGTVDLTVVECSNLDVPGPLMDVTEDCAPSVGGFDFYLAGDGTDESVHFDVEGNLVAELPAGTYTVHETSTDTAAGEIIVEEGEVTGVIFGIPGEGTPPPAETVNVGVTTYACDSITDEPVVMGEVADDCVPFASDLEFYLYGDDTDDSVAVMTSDSGPTDVELVAGTYDVYNLGTDTSVVAEIPAGTTALSIGYPSGGSEEPAPETGILNLNTFECESVEEPAVVGAVGEDCTRVGAVLSFYLVGDGTDNHISVSSSAEGTVEMELPIGDYQVVDETTQTTFQVSVTDVPADLNIAYPVGTLPVDPGTPEDPDDPGPITDLPETGTGSAGGNNIATVGALVGGAILTAAAIGTRIRNS